MWKIALPFPAVLFLLWIQFAFADGAPADDAFADQPNATECEEFCEEIALCQVPCILTSCLVYCANEMKKSDLVCAGGDTCENIRTCLCGHDPASQNNSGGGNDDDNGGCSVATGTGDIWLPLAMLLIGLAALVFSVRARRK